MGDGSGVGMIDGPTKTDSPVPARLTAQIS